LEGEDEERRRTLERQRIERRRDNVTYVLKTKQYYKKIVSSIGGGDDGGANDSRVLSPATSTANTFPSTPGSSSILSTSPSYSDYDDNDENVIDTMSNNVDVATNSPTANADDSTTVIPSDTTSPPITPICHPCINTPTNNTNTNQQLLLTTPPPPTTTTTATAYNDPYIDSDDDNDDDAETCTICILSIKDGDHIGALQCDHKFHVDCLKEWIKRRNVCPLCQSPNIAVERRSSTNDGDDDDEDDDDMNHGPIITRLTVGGGRGISVIGSSSPRHRASLLRASPPTRSTVARIRRLRDARREAVRTRLFSGGGTTTDATGATTGGT